LVLILLTIYLSGLTVLDKSSLGFFVGPYAFIHWMSLIGGFWIAIVTPIYYVLKHHRINRIKALIRIHTFGNLTAFMLISIHFTYWITTVSFMGTGLAVYVAVFVLVATGLLQRFNILQGSLRNVRFLHVSMTTAFYLVLTIHILGRIMRI
jgi:hypothetical protein